jgi:hypothetical protein
MALEAKDRESFVRSWGNVLTKSWEDEDFKRQLEADPARVLNENGVAIQEGAEVNLVDPPPDAGPDLEMQIRSYEQGQESGSYTFYVQDQSQVETQEVSEQELEGVSAGACCSSIACCCCC